MNVHKVLTSFLTLHCTLVHPYWHFVFVFQNLETDGNLQYWRMNRNLISWFLALDNYFIYLLLSLLDVFILKASSKIMGLIDFALVLNMNFTVPFKEVKRFLSYQIYFKSTECTCVLVKRLCTRRDLLIKNCRYYKYSLHIFISTPVSMPCWGCMIWEPIMIVGFITLIYNSFQIRHWLLNT